MEDRGGNKDPGSSPRTGNPARGEVESAGSEDGGGQRSPKMNGEVADDKKKDGHQSSKYKTVSYRRIRKGNTRQRIDEFEAIMNL